MEEKVAGKFAPWLKSRLSGLMCLFGWCKITSPTVFGFFSLSVKLFKFPMIFHFPSCLTSCTQTVLSNAAHQFSIRSTRCVQMRWDEKCRLLIFVLLCLGMITKKPLKVNFIEHNLLFLITLSAQLTISSYILQSTTFVPKKSQTFSTILFSILFAFNCHRSISISISKSKSKNSINKITSSIILNWKYHQSHNSKERRPNSKSCTKNKKNIFFSTFDV